MSIVLRIVGTAILVAIVSAASVTATLWYVGLLPSDTTALVPPPHTATTVTTSAYNKQDIPQSNAAADALPPALKLENATTDGITINASSDEGNNRVSAAEVAAVDLAMPEIRLYSENVAEHSRVVVSSKPSASSSDTRLTQAQILLDDGEYLEAADMYGEVLESYPLKGKSSPSIRRTRKLALSGLLYALRRATENADMTTQAITELRKLAASSDRYSGGDTKDGKGSEAGKIYAALARALQAQGDKTAAITAWERATARDPNNKEYALGLAISYDQDGNTAVALAAYRQVPPPLPAAARQRMEWLEATSNLATTDDTTTPSITEKLLPFLPDMDVTLEYPRAD